MVTHEYKLPFLTDSLKLVLVKKLDEKNISEILKLIKTLKDSLNPFDQESSAYKFRITQPGVSIKVTPEFREFLELNIRLEKQYGEFFKSAFTKDPLSSITLDGNNVVKETELEFDPSVWRKFFILDLIVEFINEKEFNSFFIQVDDIYISSDNFYQSISPAKIYKTFNTIHTFLEPLSFTSNILASTNFKEEIKTIVFGTDNLYLLGTTKKAFDKSRNLKELIDISKTLGIDPKIITSTGEYLSIV